MTGYGAPQPQTRSGQQLPLFDLIGAGLGILSFVWGFLDWYGESGGGQTIKGYGALSGASGAIGLSILASAVAANVLLDKAAKSTLIPAAAALASLLVTFGLLVGKGDGVDTKIGVILMLITALAQTALFVVGWLQSQGKIMTGTPASSSGQWGGGGGGQYGYPNAQTQQYGQQQPAQPQYGQQQQPAQPQYGQPTQHQAPAQPQAPQQQPQYGQQPPSNPYGQS